MPGARRRISNSRALRLEAALEQTALPDNPDDDAVNGFLVDAYRQAWGW
jgi:hypothetical protein